MTYNTDSIPPTHKRNKKEWKWNKLLKKKYHKKKDEFNEPSKPDRNSKRKRRSF